MHNIIIEVKRPATNQNLLLDDMLWYPFIDINVYNKTGRVIKIEQLFISFKSSQMEDVLIDDKPMIIKANSFQKMDFDLFDIFGDIDYNSEPDEKFTIKAKIENELQPSESNIFSIT